MLITCNTTSLKYALRALSNAVTIEIVPVKMHFVTRVLNMLSCATISATTFADANSKWASINPLGFCPFA